MKKINITDDDIRSVVKESLDEGKMKELAMKIADVYMKMKKDSMMKPFADKFRADVKKSLDIRKSLEKVLPDYVAGAKITAMIKEEVEVIISATPVVIELDEAMSPKAKAAAAAKARQDKKFGPGGSFSKGADAIRKVLAKDAKKNKKGADFFRDTIS